MKNKEIVKRIKDSLDYEFDLSFNERRELLLYIEQLEKRNKELYEGFMATQEELTDYATENEQLQSLCNKYEQEHKTTFEIWKEDIKKLEQLENNRDKAIEYLKEKADFPISYYHCIREAIDILKGDSDV